MATDPLKFAPKVAKKDSTETSLARLVRELRGHSAKDSPMTENLTLHETVRLMNRRALTELSAENAALRAQALKARRLADGLRNDLAVQAVSHDAHSSEYRAQLARLQADLARSQAENAALRREHDATTEELTEARLQLGDNEFEIGALRRQLQLPQRPSPLDFN
jgi:chromosome segregation ATPase